MNTPFSGHSISEILTYMDCRQRHEYRYRKRLAVMGQNTRAVLGTAVHFGIERAAKSFASGVRPNEIECVRSAWDRANEEVFGLESEIEPGVLAGIDCLHELVSDGHEILEVERSFEQTFGTWHTRGQIDLVTKRDGILHVLDWKTCKNLPAPTGFNLDPQVASYAWRAMEDYGIEECYAGRIYLRAVPKKIEVTKKGKVSLQSTTDYRGYAKFVADWPEYAIDEKKARDRFGDWYRIDSLLLSKRMVGSILERMEKVAYEIDQGLEPHPNYRPKMCGWCDYSTACMAQTLTGVFDPAAGFDIELPSDD